MLHEEVRLSRLCDGVDDDDGDNGTGVRVPLWL